MGHVIFDAHREVVLRTFGGEVVEHRLDHGRGKFLGRKAIPPAQHPGHGAEGGLARGHHLVQRRHAIEIQRFARGARFFRAIHHRDRLDRGRQGRHQPPRIERPEQPHLKHPDLPAVGVQIIHRLLRGVATRSHQHDHLLGVRRPVILIEVIAAPGYLGELFHDPRRDLGAGLIKLVAGLARLEKHVGILGCPPQDRAVRAHRPQPVRRHQPVRNHGPHLVVRK